MSSETDKYETFLRRIKVRVRRPATDHDKAKMAQGQTALLDKLDELDALLKRVKNAIRSRKDILDSNERELRSWIKSKTKEVLVECEVVIDARQGGVLLVRTLDEHRDVVKGPRPLSAKEREVFASTKSQTGFFDDPVGVNEELAKKLNLTDYISEQAPVDVDDIIATALDDADLPEDVKNAILSLDMDEDEEKTPKKKDKGEKKEKKSKKKDKGADAPPPAPAAATPPSPPANEPTPEPGPAKAERDEDAPRPPKAGVKVVIEGTDVNDNFVSEEIILPAMEGAEDEATEEPSDAPEETSDSDAQFVDDEPDAQPEEPGEETSEPAMEQADAIVEDDVSEAESTEEAADDDLPGEPLDDGTEEEEEGEEEDVPPEVAGDMSPEWQSVANAASDAPAPSEVTYDVDESDLPPDSVPTAPASTTEPETAQEGASEPEVEPTPEVTSEEPQAPATADPPSPDATAVPAKRKPGRPPKPKPPADAPPPAPATPPPPPPAAPPVANERTLANHFGMNEKLAKNALVVFPAQAGGGTPPLQGEVIFLSTAIEQFEKASGGVRLPKILREAIPSVFAHLAQTGVLLTRSLPGGDIAYWHPNIAGEADKQIAAFQKKK